MQAKPLDTSEVFKEDTNISEDEKDQILIRDFPSCNAQLVASKNASNGISESIRPKEKLDESVPLISNESSSDHSIIEQENI